MVSGRGSNTAHYNDRMRASELIGIIATSAWENNLILKWLLICFKCIVYQHLLIVVCIGI